MKPSIFLAFGILSYSLAPTLTQAQSQRPQTQPPSSLTQPQPASSQVQPQPPSTLSTLSAATIRLDPQETPPAIYPRGLFRHFEVIDERPDTARIGIHYSLIRLGKPLNLQLVFAKPATRTISGYLDQYFARPDAPYTLLIVLRNLWLSDANYLHEEVAKNPDKMYERSHLRVRMEIYAGLDSLFLPLYRLDTLVISRHLHTYDVTTAYSIWDKHLRALLNEICDSATLLMQQRQHRQQTRLVSREDILRFNQSRFTNPIDNQTLTPGVYASFEEFRNNTPSIQDFEIKMENNKPLLYIKEGETSYYTHKVWGYCDGKDIYIMRAGVLCPVWREGKAWYFPSSPPPSTANITGANNAGIRRNRIFTLDIDNGAIY